MGWTLTVCGKKVRLTRTEYAILKLLMENPGQIIARSVLLDRISTDTPDCTEKRDGLNLIKNLFQNILSGY